MMKVAMLFLLCKGNRKSEDVCIHSSGQILLISANDGTDRQTVLNTYNDMYAQSEAALRLTMIRGTRVARSP
jgi:hypothetical protein